MRPSNNPLEQTRLMVSRSHTLENWLSAQLNSKRSFQEIRNMQYHLIFTSVLLFAGCSLPPSGPQPYVATPSTWTKPRQIFLGPGSQPLRIGEASNEELRSVADKIYSPNKVYFFSEQIVPTCVLRVFNDKEQGLTLRPIPRYAHRPIRAEWINPKLLYVTVSFNPHFGAYWIYDVENETIIHRELMNDGVMAWQQNHPTVPRQTGNEQSTGE